MLIFAIDWLLLTILFNLVIFYLIPKYLLRILSQELGKLDIVKILGLVSGYAPLDTSFVVALQQIIVRHIDALLQKKFAFLATLIPDSLKKDLASQFCVYLSKRFPCLFTEDYQDRIEWLEPRLRQAIYKFFRTRRWIIMLYASVGALLAGIVHTCSIFCVNWLNS